MSAAIPTNVKRYNGNPGRRGLSQTEPDPAYLQDLTPPGFLTSERAREVWSYLAPKVADAKLLCEVDVLTFAMVCEALSEFWFAQEQVTQHLMVGGPPVIREEKAYWLPWITLRDRAAERIEKGIAHFGMSPMARTRIRVQPQTDLFAASDFEGFLNSLSFSPGVPQ